jgi:hypothetical protein
MVYKMFDLDKVSLLCFLVKQLGVCSPRQVTPQGNLINLGRYT